MSSSSKKVLITRDVESPEDLGNEGFAARHPELAYVVGPTIRGLYVVGCMALDLLVPLQILQTVPDQQLLALPVLVLAFAGLSYIEYRIYRKVWPPPRHREVVGVAGQRRI